MSTNKLLYTTQISTVRSNSFSLLSKITPSDKKLLEGAVSHFRPNSKNYEDSWGYIIQATRYGGVKWYDPNNGSLIFFGRKSETDPTLVVPSFFAEPEYLTYAIATIQKAIEAPKVILKNVNPATIDNFTPYGFRTYKEHEYWGEEALFDDQTYPQLIVELEKLIEKRGYKKLRNALNKKPHLSIRNYRLTDKDSILKLLTLKDQYSTKLFKEANELYSASHIMYLTADVDKYVIVDAATEEILGFTATSEISPHHTALVAAIFKPGSKIASIWGIYQTLAIQYSNGIEKVNLGGSETEGTYNFMRHTFRPVEKIEKTHLVYNP